MGKVGGGGIGDMMYIVYGCYVCDTEYEINGAYGEEIDTRSTSPKMSIININIIFDISTTNNIRISNIYSKNSRKWVSDLRQIFTTSSNHRCVGPYVEKYQNADEDLHRQIFVIQRNEETNFPETKKHGHEDLWMRIC